MNELEFNNIKQELSLRDIQKIELNILKEFAEFCDNNKLRYYLTGGTLLGAVRHNGFIPWDDDIDINMPRPDYEKFVKLCNGKLKQYNVLPNENNKEDDALVLKIQDTKTILKETIKSLNGGKVYYTHLFIDICPLDGLPKNTIIFHIHCTYIHFLAGLLRANMNGATGKSMYKRLIRVLMIPIAKLKKPLFWKNAIKKSCLRFDFDKSERIGAVITNNRYKDFLKKEDYLPYDDSLVFEGYHFHAPKMYEEHLKILYGDYMKIPPESKRNSGHTFIAKRII